jgi:hypothetical protein
MPGAHDVDDEVENGTSEVKVGEGMWRLLASLSKVKTFLVWKDMGGEKFRL